MIKAIGQILYMVGKALCGGTGSVEEAIKPSGTIGINEASSILLDVLEAMGDTSGAEIHLPDENINVYNMDEVKSCYELKEVSAITFAAETMDCDDFAAMLYGKFAGLVWTNLHAFNWFISEDNEFYFIEPQTRKISKTLEGWQGDDIRFFIGR